MENNQDQEAPDIETLMGWNDDDSSSERIGIGEIMTDEKLKGYAVIVMNVVAQYCAKALLVASAAFAVFGAGACLATFIILVTLRST